MANSAPRPRTGQTYRVVSVSLYSDQADVVDRATETLLNAGYAKANRSLVVQTAIQRLQEDLAGKSVADTLAYFLDRQMRRPLAAARSRSRRASEHRLRERNERGEHQGHAV